MLQLPPVLATHYRPATDLEVRSWSFGALRLPRNPDAGGWERQRHTLDDQAIFGPLRDLECACGKYRGAGYQAMICDRCGVKVTTRDARRKRFGHIELPNPVPHPLGEGGARLSAVPVLPAAYFHSSGGESLATLYDDLLRSLDSDAPEEVAERVRRVMALLVPVVVVAHEWNLGEAVTLACGLALVLRSTSGDGCCAHCGYPLAGLPTGICPGCGRVLRPGG